MLEGVGHFGCLIWCLKSRVWTGGQWVQWQTRPLHVQGNPLILLKFPLHLQTCLKYVLLPAAQRLSLTVVFLLSLKTFSHFDYI